MNNRLAMGLGSLALAVTCALSGYRLVTTISEVQAAELGKLEPQRVPENTPTASTTFQQRASRPDVYFEATLQRPIFFQDRRPRQPEIEREQPVDTISVAVNQPEQEMPDLELRGVAGSSGSYKALISLKAGNPDWVRAGDVIENWKIEHIGATWIDIRNASQEIRIEMYQ